MIIMMVKSSKGKKDLKSKSSGKVANRKQSSQKGRKVENRENDAGAKKIVKNFNGGWWAFTLMVVIGVFFPPAMSLAAVYLIYRSFPKRPSLFDRNLVIFSVFLLMYSLLSLLLTGRGFQDATNMAFSATLFTLVIMYPFVFAWLWFDWNYGKGSKA